MNMTTDIRRTSRAIQIREPAQYHKLKSNKPFLIN